MESIELPRAIDEPPTILLWSADEMAPLVLAIVLGMLIGQAFICVLIGFFISHWYRRLLRSSQEGLLVHLLYWYGLGPTKCHTLPNPYVKYFY